MRHKVAGKHLNRTSSHRQALRRNLAASLFEHGNIVTTPEKAKFVRPFAEKLITKARQGTLHARRQVIAALQDRDICTVTDGEPEKVGTVVSKLFQEIAPRYNSRPGGYTRIINLPFRRVGDNGRLVMLQLVEEEIRSRPVRRESESEDTVAPAAEQRVSESAEAATQDEVAAAEEASDDAAVTKVEQTEDTAVADQAEPPAQEAQGKEEAPADDEEPKKE